MFVYIYMYACRKKQQQQKFKQNRTDIWEIKAEEKNFL